MQVTFDCPRCLNSDSLTLQSNSTAVACRHCGWTRPLGPGDIRAETPQQCLICGCSDLWRQKDFPAHWGLAIVGLGILLSTLAVAFYRPMLGLGILMLFALADMILFALMRDALVCYRCHARYRGVGASEQHPKFNLELNERYRQEAARLHNTSAMKATPSWAKHSETS